MKVWAYKQNEKTLLNQRLLVFLWNIIYTVFYTLSYKAINSNHLGMCS